VRVRRIDRLIQRVLSSSTTVTEKACFDNGIFLDFDGFLYQCPGLAGSRDQAIGHIEDAKSLKGIFASDFAIRQSVALNGVFQKCNSCDLYDLCPGGCYYNASVEGTLPDDPVFCKFFRVVAPHVIERVYSSFAANSKIASLE
jgi:radical SAM protein with 4Fe4S-binding SPASM domain